MEGSERIERIVGVKIMESTIGDVIDGPPFVFASMEDGDDVPMFPFDRQTLNYDPAQFVGMSLDEAYEFKRIKDLIWYRTITF